MNETELKVREILSFLLELPENTIYEELTSDSVSGWDSMKQVILIGAIENEFDIYIDAKDAASLNSYKSLVKYLG